MTKIKIPMRRNGNSPVCYVTATPETARDAQWVIVQLEMLGYKADTKILCEFFKMAVENENQ